MNSSEALKYNNWWSAIQIVIALVYGALAPFTFLGFWFVLIGSFLIFLIGILRVLFNQKHGLSFGKDKVASISFHAATGSFYVFIMVLTIKG